MFQKQKTILYNRLKKLIYHDLKISSQTREKIISFLYRVQFAYRVRNILPLFTDYEFDSEWYLAEYPEVEKMNMDPLVHYLRFGWREGRNPRKDFDSVAYLLAYEDIKRSGAEPFTHYLAHGRKEGRSPQKMMRDYKKTFEVFEKSLKEAGKRGSTGLVFDHVVDIIIPIYKKPELLEKILSDIQSKTAVSYRLLLVNDSPDDGEVKNILAQWEDKFENVLIIHNSENYGFTKSINAGLDKSENHVVILNTDVELPHGWLQRLITPILLDDEIASVTPFTNSGTIASFPRMMLDNDLIWGLSVDQIDAVFQKYSPAITIKAPTGVGFCMAMNKNAVREVGNFDEEKYGKGYGEENDWCRRAVELGYKNVISPAIFVYHKHGGAFPSELKKQLMSENMGKLLDDYPDYPTLVNEFVHNDLLMMFRTFSLINLAVRVSGKKVKLILDHDLGGGANLYIEHKNQHEKEHLPIIYIKGRGEKYNIEFLYQEYDIKFHLLGLESIQFFISSLPIGELYLNNLVAYSSPLDLIGFLLETKKEKVYDLVVPVHDYFNVCPSYSLTDFHDKFCGIPLDLSVCETCAIYNQHFVVPEASIVEWRKKWGNLLLASNKVVVFSESTKGLMLRAYPDLEKKIKVVPHTLTWKPRKVNVPLYLEGSTLNIGVVGNINSHKGLDVMLDLEKFLRKEHNAKITVFGNTAIPIESKYFKIKGSYVPHELPNLLESEKIHVILFPSVVPETFSYVIHEVIAMGIPVLSFDLGAQRDAVQDYYLGKSVPLGSKSEIILDELKKLAEIWNKEKTHDNA